MKIETIYENFLNIILNKVSSITYNTWFKDIKFYEIDGDYIKIIVPYEAHKNHLLNNYNDIIEEAIAEVTGKFYEIKYIIESEVTKDIEDEILVFDAEEKDDFIEEYKYYSNFNPKYTFDTFIVGDSNRFAYSSALAVAQKPGKLYNPLFIYGKSGLGKTHLMHSIGNYIKTHSKEKVLYITSEQFINDFITLSKKDDETKNNFNYMEMFKKKYRDVDVLMIDDIQFLGSATKSQQEFTNTFNNLYDSEKQIIICSDRSVDDLKLLEDRLKTRFNWGLKADINPPDFELKVKIIKNKIKIGDLVIELDDDVINFVAANCGSDVRNLEGAITRLCAYQAIMNIEKLNIEYAMEALKDYTKNLIYSPNTIVKIQNAVSSYYKIQPEDLKGKKRIKLIANARQIAMYLCRILTEETYPRIGLEFGGRDHSTVIHSYEKVSKDLQNNQQLGNIIIELKNIISG
jgi:chromosomal replication initiator protein